MWRTALVELQQTADIVNARIAETLGAACLKFAADATLSYGLAGRLYLSRSGWLLLKVPNALGQGAFDALHELGVEVPTSETTGRYEAHISVMRADEVERVGPGRISEVGHSIPFTLGPVKTVVPRGWPGVSRVWFIECRSPALEQLRRSYGLPSLPTPRPCADGYPFHITFAIRRAGVLRADTAVEKAPT